MAVNLIDLLRHELSDDVIARLGWFLGESPDKTQSALGYAVPAVVGALAQKVQSPQGANDLFSTLQRAGFDGSKAFASLNSQLTAQSGSSGGLTDLTKGGGGLVSWLFGSRLNSLTEGMAASSGMRTPSAGALLALIAPFIMRLVSREAVSLGGFNTASLTQLLGAQGPFLASLAPAGLAQVLGLSSWTERAKTAVDPARAYRDLSTSDQDERQRRPAGLGWLKWAIPLLLLPLLFWAWRSARSERPARADVGASGSAATGAAAGVPALVERTLTCGSRISASANGVEANLIGFLDDRARPVDNTTWFTFDRLQFETASATLKPESQAQVRNVAEILKCYPNAAVKVGGYTDNVGNPASNMTLSRSRAESTVRAIAAEGIDTARLEAEGYGEQHPVASNDTEDGRQRNRRIDLRVTRK